MPRMRKVEGIVAAVLAAVASVINFLAGSSAIGMACLVIAGFSLVYGLADD